MTRSLAALIATLMAGAAAADPLTPPPEIYGAARERAPDVIFVSVDEVTVATAAPWFCTVKAHVRQVERGQRYRVGQKIKVPVRCAAAGAPVHGPPSAVFQDTATLVGSKWGHAYMESGYPLLDQYDIVPAPPQR